MSFDLAFWYEREPSSPEQAAKIYDQLTDEEHGVVEQNPALGEFYQEVIATYGDLTEGGTEDTPWTSGVYRNEECVLTPIAWSRCKEVAPVLAAMATRHGLTTYDPQKCTVYYPSGGSARGVPHYSE
jgi:hypothetical protein